MVEYRNPDQHFAQQRTTQAAEYVSAASEAQYEGGKENRSTNEKFYNSLAIFSSGTIALSVTFLGYLKSLPKPVQHPHWLVACWICLMACAACSLFWPFVYGYYSHYFHERQTAKAQKEKYETDAKEFPTLVRGSVSVQTNAPTSRKELEDFVSNRMEASAICDKRAKHAQRWENFYMHFWRWLGRIAQASFLGGLGLLLAFAIRNM
jgi:hypothetical protein